MLAYAGDVVVVLGVPAAADRPLRDAAPGSAAVLHRVGFTLDSWIRLPTMPADWILVSPLLTKKLKAVCSLLDSASSDMPSSPMLPAHPELTSAPTSEIERRPSVMRMAAAPSQSACPRPRRAIYGKPLAAAGGLVPTTLTAVCGRAVAVGRLDAGGVGDAPDGGAPGKGAGSSPTRRRRASWARAVAGTRRAPSRTPGRDGRARPRAPPDCRADARAPAV